MNCNRWLLVRLVLINIYINKTVVAGVNVSIFSFLVCQKITDIPFILMFSFCFLPKSGLGTGTVDGFTFWSENHPV